MLTRCGIQSNWIRVSVQLLCHKKKGLKKEVEAGAWQAHKHSTSRNHYAMSSELMILKVLRWIILPFFWTDVGHIFWLQASHLSDIFWEGLYQLFRSGRQLFSGPIHAGNVSNIAARYASTVHRKFWVLNHWIEFIDRILIVIARPRFSKTEHSVQQAQ